MNPAILNHHRQFGMYTYPGLYEEKLKNDLPDDVRKIGSFVRKNFIHRTTVDAGNVGTNADLRFGDMTQLPWWHQPEDDMLPTAGAMLTELYRRDPRGFVADRAVADKLILTCRYVAIIMASILKSKGIPARVRSGNADYFDMGELGEVSTDHWINQYWDEAAKRWITIDVDGSLSLNADFDPYDMPDGVFDFPADAWLAVRSGEVDPNHFYNAGGAHGLIVVLWSLFYDFHSLMNNEILYIHGPVYSNKKRFASMSESELKHIDDLARLMQQPDEQFDALHRLWETDKTLRLLTGGLL